MHNLTRSGSLISLYAVMTVVTEAAGESYARASRLRMISD